MNKIMAAVALSYAAIGINESQFARIRKMKNLKYLLLCLLTFSTSAFATCTVTLNPGTNVISTAASSGSNGDTICLNAGSYTQTVMIDLKAGQNIEGLGSARTDTVINSSATKVIDLHSNNTLFNFQIMGSSPVVYGSIGVYGHTAPNSLIWGLRIEQVHSALELHFSDDSSLWDLYTLNIGSPTDGQPQTAVFFYKSDRVEMLWGYHEGEDNGPFGDGGSVACFGGTEILIDHVQFYKSGNSAVYFVDCDDSTVQYSDIYESNEWGLDIVGGETAGYDWADAPHYLNATTGFTAIGNDISYSWFGGSVYDGPDNGTGVYQDNTFVNNNVSGNSTMCNGITIIPPGTASSNYISGTGNTVNTGVLICPP